MRFFGREYKAYSWTKQEDNAFRGYFIVGDKLYKGEDAIGFLNQIVGTEKMNSDLSLLDGSFTFVIEKAGKVYFGVDRVRTMPLLYSIIEGELYVGDDADAILNHHKERKVNEDALKEFKDTYLFVTGNDTLMENLFQLRAAELIVFDLKTGTCRGERYCDWREMFKNYNVNIDGLKQEFFNVYNALGKELVLMLNGRTAVIPLSGGADSRMIVKMLHDQGYKNVICFTYGRRNNEEARISEKVANKYEYPWHFIEYTTDAMKKLRNTSELREYMKFASMYCSLPHLQDFYAVWEMKRRGIVPADSVFIPGHGGDNFTGNRIRKEYVNGEASKKAARENMLKLLYRKNIEDYLKKMEELYPILQQDVEEYAAVEFDADVTERQAKYINNSVRVYEFFEYEWLMPLWSIKLSDFWKKVPMELRLGRRFYYMVLGDNQRSTNNDTLGKRVAQFLRENKISYLVCKFLVNVLNWWFFKIPINRIFSSREYFRKCLTMNPKEFNSLLLLNQLLLSDILC